MGGFAYHCWRWGSVRNSTKHCAGALRPVTPEDRVSRKRKVICRGTQWKFEKTIHHAPERRRRRRPCSTGQDGDAAARAAHGESSQPQNGRQPPNGKTSTNAPSIKYQHCAISAYFHTFRCSSPCRVLCIVDTVRHLTPCSPLSISRRLVDNVTAVVPAIPSDESSASTPIYSGNGTHLSAYNDTIQHTAPL